MGCSIGTGARITALQRVYRLLVGRTRGGVTIDEAVLISEAIDEAANRLQVKLVDLLLESAEGLTDDQIQDFLDELDRQQEEYAQERLVRDDITYADDAADSLQRLAKRLLGRLNDEQKALIQSRSTELMRIDRLWHEDRSVWGRSSEPY